MNDKHNSSRRTFVNNSVKATAALTMFPSLPMFGQAKPSKKSLKLAEKHRAELLDLLQDMIKVQSIGGESCDNAQAIVEAYLKKLPYRIDRSEDRPSLYQDHPEYMTPNPAGDGPFVNVVGWPEKQSKPTFAMFSHIDTHSVEDGWSTNPLEPKLVDHKLYGLGTADDKAGVAAMLVATKILASEGDPLPVVMSLHGKGGGGRGSLPVFERIRKTDHNFGAVLYVHPAETGKGLVDIKNAVQGIADLQLKMTGWRGEALEIGSIDSAEWSKGGSAVDRCIELFDLLKKTVFKDILVNIGIFEGGDRIGSIADEVTVTFRLKFSGDYTWKALLKETNKTIDQFIADHSTSDHSYQAKLNIVGYMTNPGAADWEAPESKVLRSAITEVMDKAPTAYPNHYAGDIRYPIRLLGVPAYGIGSIAGNFYLPDEWVDVNDLVRLVAVLIDTMNGWHKL